MEVKLECLEMVKALYQFKATIEKTLSFRENEYFVIYQASTKQRNWWQVINSKAQVGYVPSNYVISVQVTSDFILKFLNDCIALLRKESDKADGFLPNDRQEVLLKLLERKEEVDKVVGSKSQTTINADSSSAPSPRSSVSRISPPLLLYSQKRLRNTQSSSAFSLDKKEEEKAKSPVLERKSMTAFNRNSRQPLDRKFSTGEVSDISGQVGTPLSEAKKSGTSLVQPAEETVITSVSRKSSCHTNEVITEETVYRLVEQVRFHTELSHELSRVAVNVVVSELQKYIPNSAILEKILLMVQTPITATKPLIEHTHDAKRLNVIFCELTSCKNDSEQRSWMLHEDEAVIIDYVEELTSILMNADANVSRYVISSDQYTGVFALVQYYQMEVRWSIRQPLLKALSVLCTLDRAVISIFLTSILPMELARDMKANPRNIPRLHCSGVLLTIIFSTGEPMPVTHLEHLGADFIAFLLNSIEDPPDSDVEDQIPDLFITLILSYNLQFKNSVDNITLSAISQRSVAKTFTEKILLLLNREDDPVKVLSNVTDTPHSVLKLFVDLFSNSATANLFYTNDVKVLIDIILRQLADLPSSDQRRCLYLKLCRVVIRNSGYSEHHHRKDDIAKAFTRIFCEESETSVKDQQLVREISNEFPQYFK